jgi:D-alanyl-D-alanine carboxypeptidase/D-alanyl-D-alanine-endopeptidase (penicillin-binding protein 4)
VVTALYAMDRLGPVHRFVTRLIATGPIEGGTVRGDLVLSGSGDPTLQTDGLAELAVKLRARGVTGVSGRFLLHDAALPELRVIDPAQPDYVGYNPAISGLNLNFNRVHFEWRRGASGWDVAMDARSELVIPPVRMARMRVVQRETPLFTFAEDEGIDSWTVASGALGKGGSRWLPVRQPGIYTGDVFRTLARAQGIGLPEPEQAPSLPEGMVLVEGASEPLPEVLRDMLKFSTNLTAEVVGLTASEAATLAESGRAMSGWAAARYGRAGAFVDHSGLGDASRAAPADMVAALVAARGGPLRGMLKPFAMRDGKGREVKDHPVQVAAKTGTLNFCSALVGYAAAPGGRTVAFAIFAADVPRREAVPLADREEPPGAKSWARRSRVMQSQLIEHWTGRVG